MYVCNGYNGGRTEVYVTAKTTVRDVFLQILDKKTDRPQCNTSTWRVRRDIAIDKKTGKETMEVQGEEETLYVSYDGALERTRKGVTNIRSNVLELNKIFVYSKKYSNILTIVDETEPR